MPGALPGVRSRTERFDELVSIAVTVLENRCGRLLDGVEFGVEDIPPSTPPPWEHGAVPLGRYFPADLGMPHRVVLYRRPIIARTATAAEQFALISHVLAEQVAHLMGWHPDDL